MATFDQNNGHYRWSPDAATATVSLEGIVTGWSEGARRLLGHRAPEVVGRAAAELLVARETPEATGVSLTASQEWSGTAALRHRDGHRVDVTLHAHPSLGADGTTQGFVVSATLGPTESERDRRMLEWAFAQSSIALTTYTTASRSWQMNATAESGDQAPRSPYPALLTAPPPTRASCAVCAVSPKKAAPCSTSTSPRPRPPPPRAGAPG